MTEPIDASLHADVPLFADMNGDSCMDQYDMEFDEDGSLALARALQIGADRSPGTEDRGSADRSAKRPCKASALNGSWYLQLVPRGPHALIEIRGPMRIEVASPKLRASGDIYVRQPPPGTAPVEILRPITERALLFGKNWYPQFPLEQYSWYFRSLGVTYRSGKLVIKYERHLWNKTTQEFIGQENSGRDTGFMELECFEGNVLNHPLLPQPTLRITGTARIGGDIYDAVATKTSPFQRGCVVEVDVLTQRQFPQSATTMSGAVISFASIYRSAGIDCQVGVDRTDLPDDAELSTIELQTALTANRRPPTSPDAWRLWLLVGSRQGQLFGLMFDDTEPFREGTAGFYDVVITDDPIVAPGARNKKLGEVPDAFLRTLVHEAGHAFNLFHPKHDVHNVAIGTTIMNQTGDVMQFATETNPYPGNITFAFDDHNRSSLMHSPDPQVAPGWKRFGWGHGSLSSGIAEPVDAAGFLRGTRAPADLKLELRVPDHIYRGQFVTAQFVVTNIGAHDRTLTAALNLSQGDLRLLLKPPTEELQDVRDVIVACGDRAFVTLKPGESLTGSGQIFYTNVGFTFRQMGRYFVSAELDIGDGTGQVLKSDAMPVVVRSPITPAEEEVARLSMQTGVGRAFAFGDYGIDAEAKASLETLASSHNTADSGIAAALTLANACGCELRDLYSGDALRKTDSAQAARHFENSRAALGNDLQKLVRVATAVAAPTEANAPVLGLTEDFLASAAGDRAAADTARGATVRAARAPPRAAGARRRAAAAPVAAIKPPTPGASQALEALQNIRRTFARRS